MTDSDPLADLTARLEELAAQLEVWRGQWARSQSEIGVLRERLETETGQTIMLRLEVKQLLAEVKRLAGQLEPQEDLSADTQPGVTGIARGP